MFKKVLLSLVAVTIVFTAAFAEAKTTITVGADCTWPPMEFLNSDKTITGFAPELLEAMGKAADIDFKVANVAWDGIFAGLGAGKYDMVSSSVTITEKRKRAMDFSDPYFEVRQAVVVAKDSNIGSLADLKGKVAGAQIGTTGYFAAKKADGVTAKTYDEIGLAIEDLFSGRINAVICDDPVAANYALLQPEYAAKLKIGFVIETAEKEFYGFAIAKGKTDVLKKVNEALAKVKANGEYDRIKEKWFGKN